MSKSALITGVTGQDGAYLSEHLLALGYRVLGGFRRSSSENFWRLDALGVRDYENFQLVEYDLTDASSISRLVAEHRPSEIYNLAAQSFVGTSFQQPLLTTEATGKSVVHFLEAIRQIDQTIRFYQASTSEMFGLVQSVPQNENTPFYPRSPYGVAKLFAHWMTVNYRESYDMFCASGILFNHESPLRGKEFVTRKITDGVARIASGAADAIELGNLDAKRDWGFAKDYVQGMHLMLTSDVPDTYVLATGRTETVRHFVEMSFKAVNIEIEWSGTGVDEIGVERGTGKTRVKINPKFYRPAEVDLLLGDPSHAERKLGWKATTSLEELCAMMVKSDLQRVASGWSF